MGKQVNVEPGFYADPENPARQRWWDGESWATAPSGTTRVSPPPVQPVADPGPPRNNQFAMASLVLSISWVFFIGSILGVIFGHLALAQIRESDGREVGRGNAMIGLILGYAGLAAGLLLLLIFLG